MCSLCARCVRFVPGTWLVSNFSLQKKGYSPVASIRSTVRRQLWIPKLFSIHLKWATDQQTNKAAKREKKDELKWAMGSQSS